MNEHTIHNEVMINAKKKKINKDRQNVKVITSDSMVKKGL